MSRSSLHGFAWPMRQMDRVIEALARHRGLLATDREQPESVPPPASDDPELSIRWVEALAEARGLEVEPLETPYLELPQLLRGGGPAILALTGEGPPRCLALAGTHRGRVALLAPTLEVGWFPAEQVRAALAGGVERAVLPEVEGLLDRAGVRGRRRSRACRALLEEQLRSRRLGGQWLLRLPPGASFWQQLRLDRLPRRLLVYFGTHLLQYLLMMLAWWLVGRGALQGNLDSGWLWAWALLLLTMVPFQLLLLWTQGRIAIGVGTLLKQRLLHGALQLEPEEVKHQGAGQVLSRVMESAALESLALSTGFSGVVALLEVAMALSVLALGAGGSYHVLLLLLWLALVAALSRRFFVHTRGWTDARLDLTQDLVERMVGHRTRLAQEARDRWHDGEDEALDRYLACSARLDRTAVQLSGIAQRGWMAVALAGLAPAFVAGGASSTAVAVSLGGILLASGALGKVERSLASLATTLVAWRNVRQLYHAAAREGHLGTATGAIMANAAAPDPAPAQPPGDASGPANPLPAAPLLEAHQLIFRYRPEAPPVLDGCDLSIYRGERVLLEGASGGGKSTLASLLSGLRAPQSGLLLLAGLDLRSLGRAAWRRKVAAAPQFHENHVLTGTFAFNLLMGRRWPPSPADLQEAEQVCNELGLQDLLQRMPAGLNQVVGDTGWRLSHGEQSRLFIARTLLQRAEIGLLDESFAALDPENLALALRCVLRRSPTLVVIAHP